jgi:protein-S-isoprenylcysteine O-methyltransferase Ste14
LSWTIKGGSTMAESADLSKSKAYLVPVLIMIVMGLILFLPAGSLSYWQGWLWWGVISGMTLYITAYFVTRDPGLLARRMKIQEKEPLPLMVRILSLLSLVTYLLPGFDYRFHWSAVPVWLVICAALLVLIGYILIFRVFKENSYAATIIQVEKEQKVISTGPYAIVRHPMYSGLLLIMLFTPLALGSYWAWLFAVLFIPVIVFRIRKEEKVLLAELKGYRNYCVQTRYRLIPLIW